MEKWNNDIPKEEIQVEIIIPMFHYPKFIALFQSSFLSQFLQDLAQLRRGFRGGLLAFPDRLVALGEIVGATLATAHFCIFYEIIKIDFSN